MKNYAASLDSVLYRISSIETDLISLEKDHLELDKKMTSLLVKAAELESESGSSAGAYITERIRRLNELLAALKASRGYDSSEYSVLMRQISKIKDIDIGDYLSPSLNRRIDRIASRIAQGYRGEQGSFCQNSGQNYPYLTGKAEYFIIRLNNIDYLIYGTLEDPARINPEEFAAIRRFPRNSAGKADHVKSGRPLVFINSEGYTLRLQWDAVIERMEKFPIAVRPEKLTRENDFIEGRIIYRGRPLYIIRY